MSQNSIKTQIEKRNYSKWKYINTNTNLPTEIHNNRTPAELSLFHNDIFVFDENKFTLIHSEIRSAPYIPGILILEGNRTYGRTTLKKRLLYKCIPDNPLLPAFLVPYDFQLGFSKKLVNKFVLFRFSEWTAVHPIGILTETIGDVNNNALFCEYRLCCRSLRAKSFNEMKRKIESQMEDKRTYIENMIQTYNVCNRTGDYVIAIDPEGSRDYDDAFSCRQINDDAYIVSVHIANVVLWIESLHLWEHMSTITNVSSIYLPDKRRPMLPLILSENLCSLTADGDKRIALTLDIKIDTNGQILATKFSNSAILISKNYVYESAECLEDSTYKILFKLAKMQSADIHDSHDVVAHWMMKMNHIAGKFLAKRATGIFRKATCSDERNIVSVGIPEDTRKILQSWANISAEYCIKNTDMPIEHCAMNLQNYVHITSPIRRLVDILNQIAIIQQYRLTELSIETSAFLRENLAKIMNINENSRAIKKTQQECDTLYKITENPDIMEKEWQGIIVDIDEDRQKINVYLEELKLMISVGISCEQLTDLHKYTYHMFRVYVFEDEYKIMNKLRWIII